MTTIRTGAGLALLGVLGVGIATTNTDAVVAGHFAAALEAAPRQAAVDVAGADKALVSGSEAYWLERRRHEGAGAAIEPAAWTAPAFMSSIAVGSRITVATGKEAHVFEVVAINETAAEGSGNRAERRVVITCRDLSTRDGRLQTFATTVGGPEATRSARAL